MRKYLYFIMTDQVQGPVAFLVKTVLLLFSLVYGLVVKVHDLCYQWKICPIYRHDKPVISVGNITVGGVGKTPLVESLARFLKERGASLAILTRGYMGEQSKGSVVSDEATVLEESLTGVPVIVDKDRVRAAKKVAAQYSDAILILDDGFQHRRMGRDIDIVAVNATNPFGNKYLIPRGVLRESLSALKRASLFVITKSDLGSANVAAIKETLRSINAKAIVVEAIHKPRGLRYLVDDALAALEFIRDKKICSFCSIGDPSSFVESLKMLGADSKKNFAFMDHHAYDEADIKRIVDYAVSHDIDLVVTTSKDAVKVRDYKGFFHSGTSCLILDMNLVITKGEEEFYGRINHIL